MAVIREQRQFKIGPVGVARASEAGAITARGKQVAANTIAQAANQLAGEFFDLGAQFAQKKGTELGMSASTEAVMTIDPKTGKPQAYKPDQFMGLIASDAYERVVMNRFQQSMENEIQNKAKELAVKYENSPNSAALYETAMSEYIASMTNVAEGPFKGYIQDVGTSYLQATRTNLAINQMRREREQAAAAQASAVTEGSFALQAMIAELGPNAFTGPTNVAAMMESLSVTVNDGVEAGVFQGNTQTALRRAVNMAPVKGLLEYAARNAKDPEALSLLRYAVASQDFASIPPEFSYVRDVVAQLGNNPEVLGSIEKFADDVLGDKVEFLKIEQDREARLETARLAQMSYSLGANTPAMAAQYRNSAFTADPIVSARRIGAEWTTASTQISSAIAAGQTDYAKALTESRDALFNASVNGLYLRAINDLSTNDTNILELAISKRDVSVAPASAQDELAALFKLEAINPNVVDDFLPFIGSYRESAGKAIDSINEMSAAAQLDQITLDITNVTIARGDEIASSVATLTSKIANIPNLDPSLRDSRIKDVQSNGSRAFVSDFFLTNPTAPQIEEAKAYLAGGDAADILTQGQRAFLDSARVLAAESGRLDEVRTHFNNLSGAAFDRQRRIKEQAEAAYTLGQIMNAQGDPTDANQRKLFETHLQQTFGPAFNNRPLASLWNDPAALSNPLMAPMLDYLRTTNILPESLHDAFTSAARGGFSGGNISAVASLYANLRNFESDGQTIRNPAMLALSEAQVATLDYIADALPVVGSDPAAIAQLFRLRSEFASDPMFQKRIETTFGMKMEDVVMGLDGIENVPSSAYNAMLAAGLEIFKIASPQGASASDMIDRLQSQLDRTYVDGGGVVFDAVGNRRTNAAISFAAPGNEAEFRGYAVNRAREALSDKVKFVQFDTSGALMRATLGGLQPSEQLAVVYLEPVGIPGSGGNYTYVVKQRMPNGFDEVVVTSMQMSDDAGKPITVFAPLTVSNTDPRFRNIIAAKNAARVSDVENAIRSYPSEIPIMP